MKKVILIFILLFIGTSFAKSQTDIKTVMHSYLHSIKTANRAELKEVVSDKYYKILSKDGQLENLFKTQTKDDKKILFDIRFQKYHHKKNLFLVNVKDKAEAHYSHYWYVVELKDGKYKILKEEFLD